jgi:energy-coupling factor transporter transmembrane protein EcfT
MTQVTAFSYKAGNSVFHKMPAWIKVLFIPLFNIAVFSINWRFALCAVSVQAVLFFVLKFSLREQFCDLTPVIIYAVFMYLVDVISFTYLNLKTIDFFPAAAGALKASFLNENTFSTVLKFFACNQSAALMFKTSTGLELRKGIEQIELAVRKILPVKKEAQFSLVISMFILFIPAVFKIWGELKRAWTARGGKNSLKMYAVLFPLLFNAGLKYAWNTARAVSIRLSQDFYK